MVVMMIILLLTAEGKCYMERDPNVDDNIIVHVVLAAVDDSNYDHEPTTTMLQRPPPQRQCWCWPSVTWNLAHQLPVEPAEGVGGKSVDSRTGVKMSLQEKYEIVGVALIYINK